MLKNIKLILLESNVDNFIHDYAEDILIQETSITDLLEQNDITYLTEEQLQPYIHKLREIYNHLFQLITDTNVKYVIYKDFNEFLKKNDIKVEFKKEWMELVYNMLYELIPKKTESKLPFGMPELNTNMVDTTLFKRYNTATTIVTRDRLNEKKQLKDDVKLLSEMRNVQNKTLNTYGNITGLWSGLSVLIYACIAGIIIPSLLLPYPLNKYDDMATREVLLALFFSQLFFLFVYLGLSMYKLTKEE